MHNNFNVLKFCEKNYILLGEQMRVFLCTEENCLLNLIINFSLFFSPSFPLGKNRW